MFVLLFLQGSEDQRAITICVAVVRQLSSFLLLVCWLSHCKMKSLPALHLPANSPASQVFLLSTPEEYGQFKKPFLSNMSYEKAWKELYNIFNFFNIMPCDNLFLQLTIKSIKEKHTEGYMLIGTQQED